MGLLGAITVTGDGFNDFGVPNHNLSDIIWTITSRPTVSQNVDSNNPGQVYKVGYVAYGATAHGSTDPDDFVIIDMRYVSFEREDWAFLNDVRGEMQFIQWHLLPGYELEIQVFVY